MLLSGWFTLQQLLTARGQQSDLYSRKHTMPCKQQGLKHTRWKGEPSGAFCSTGVDHIQSPFVHGLCVGPTMKPLLCPRS